MSWKGANLYDFNLKHDIVVHSALTLLWVCSTNANVGKTVSGFKMILPPQHCRRYRHIPGFQPCCRIVFFFLLKPKINQWQFSNFPYHSSSTFPVILNRILPACDHIADTKYPPPNTSTNRNGCSYSQIFPSILSFRHCSKLNPSSLSQTSIFPVFIFLSLPCWMYVFDTEASGIMEWLVRGLYFLPMLLGWCIIVAEEVIWHW